MGQKLDRYLGMRCAEGLEVSYLLVRSAMAAYADVNMRTGGSTKLDTEESDNFAIGYIQRGLDESDPFLRSPAKTQRMERMREALKLAAETVIANGGNPQYIDDLNKFLTEMGAGESDLIKRHTNTSEKEEVKGS